MTASHYFSLLNLAPAFELDPQALEAAYFRQQRLFHPDRFIGKPDKERQQALQRSVDLNQAYQTLKDPLKRAQYLLQLQGITVGKEQGGLQPSNELLLEVMQWREQMEEADAADRQKLVDSLMQMQERSLLAIGAAYLEGQWDIMGQETLRLGYIMKTLSEARKYGRQAYEPPSNP